MEGEALTEADRQRLRADALEARLQEAQSLIEAIQSGEVDAVVVDGPGGGQVYTLRDADRPYRVLIEQMRQGAMTLSADGIILYANQAIAQLAGLPVETIVGQSFLQFIADGDAPAPTLASLLDAETSELLFRTGAHATPVQISVNELQGDGDAGRMVCAVVTDLTDEKRRAADLAASDARLAAEAARREGEAFAHLIIDSSIDFAIIATDRQGRVTTWNTGASNIFGWSSDDMIGQPADRIWTAEDHKDGIPAEEMARADDAGRAEDDRWHLRKDGSRFWASGLTMPLRASDTGQLGYVRILRDRTRTRAIDAALHESEARLRFALAAGRLGSWELDLTTGALTASETLRENFGRRADQPFTYEALCASVHPDDRARMLAAVDKAIADRRDYDIEFQLLTPTDDVRWVQMRGRPIYGEDGAPLRMVGVSADITERRFAEAKLQRLNETLETQVFQEVATRNVAEEALRQSQKMEAVGQLTGGVAHDFNNLLTVIKSSTDLLRRDNLPEDRRLRYVNAISDTVERAAKLTGQLLAFARRQALKPELFDVPERVGSITDMLRTIVGARVEIVTQLVCRDGCLVDADASQFDTALVNMAVNARDAMAGAGRLAITIGESDGMPAIRTHGGGVGPFVAISVTDDGCGIPADMLANIFEPFFTTKDVGKGTGLGLSQVYGFAKQSGGDVAVESVFGEGSTFTLYLPRAEGEIREEAVQTEGPETSDSGVGLRVLVVEDNVEVGAFSTQMLGDLGYKTTWAASGGDALNRLEQARADFDIVFTDVVMPGISGVDLGLEIRHRYPDLPVVLTSGYSHVLAEDGRQGFELVQKPYAVDEISRVLRRALAKARAGRQAEAPIRPRI